MKIELDIEDCFIDEMYDNFCKRNNCIDCILLPSPIEACEDIRCKDKYVNEFAKNKIESFIKTKIIDGGLY